MLQGCTFTKDQYDHILKIVQQKSHAPTVSNATLLVQQVKILLLLIIIKCGLLIQD